jgi:hypothetical protein
LIPPICLPPPIPLKKSKGRYSARRAAIGARTIKSGKSRWFIGYKKHTLRLWLPQRLDAVLLVPLMTWVAPANRGDVLFLEPSLRYCQKHLNFLPDLLVADMAYINLAMQRRVREELHVGIVTKLRPDFDLPKAIEPGVALRCSQGQPLEWLGLHEEEKLHWFGVREANPLCLWCWQQSRCPREFSFAPTDHEIIFGMVPVNSRTGKTLLRQVRPWIEATQAYEKKQLGLDRIFLNSLRLTWIMALLADTASLLRARAILTQAPVASGLFELLPNQINLDFD